MKATRPPIWFFAALWLIVLGAFALGLYVARHRGLPEPQATALQVVLQEIERSHVDEQDPGKLLDLGIKAIANFDHYGQYVPQSEVDGYVEATTGTYAGIGVATLVLDGRMYVKFPFAGGPAEQAGLLPGDEVVAVEGASIAAMTAEERAKLSETRIRGEVGTKVRLTVAADGGATRDVVITRGEVHKPAVRWTQIVDAEQRIGYLWLSEFQPGAETQVAEAIERLSAQPGGLRGLVLDLRFDGGGYLDACIAIANLFLRSGVIATVRGRGGVTETKHEAVPDRCRFPDLPLTLLVNADSASASEVLTGALQDHDRATVVGELTYGKGMVNTLFSYKNLPFRLKVTTGHYVTPKGRDLEGHHQRAFRGDKKGGIVPDVEVALDPSALRAAWDTLTDHEPPEAYREAVAALCKRHDVRAPGILPPDADPQLAAAIQAVRERIARVVGDK